MGEELTECWEGGGGRHRRVGNTEGKKHVTDRMLGGGGEGGEERQAHR